MVYCKVELILGGGESIIRKKNDFGFIAMVRFLKKCNHFLPNNLENSL